MFLIKSLKNPSSHFNILDFITFNISNTRSSSYLKLRHSVCKSNIQGHFYFHRIPRLWNSLPQIDTIVCLFTLLQTLIPTICAHTITFVHALTVLSFQSKCNLIILCNDLFIYMFVFFYGCWLSSLQTFSTDIPHHPYKLLSLYITVIPVLKS